MASKSPPTVDSTPQSSATQPSSSQTPKLDDSFYTWTSFFNILLNRSTPQETSSYFLARDIKNEEADCKRCESQVAKLFQRSPIIRFMRSETEALGHDVGPEKILCRRCTTPQSGGFDSDYGIMICANHMRNRGHIEDTLAHEMVHAYDHLRFKIDRWNLRHQACTEIRASTLSGECRFMREFFTRRQYKITQQLQECVRRRATLSLMGRPECKDDVHAARIVNEVWDSCFQDTRPFDEIYR